MLKLRHVTKDYLTGDTKVCALKDVNIDFRKNEFVAVLGPSGCGKTTLLNIIGGLDRYTEGDLIINGVSTKEYKDGDWDTFCFSNVQFDFPSNGAVQCGIGLDAVGGF